MIKVAIISWIVFLVMTFIIKVRVETLSKLEKMAMRMGAIDGITNTLVWVWLVNLAESVIVTIITVIIA